MIRTKPSVLKLCLNIFIIFAFLLVIYFMFLMNNNFYRSYLLNKSQKKHTTKINLIKPLRLKHYNVWLVFTKVSEVSPLRYKFHSLLENMLNVSSVPLTFNIIVDNSSKQLAADEISSVTSYSKKSIYYKFYSVEACAEAIDDIVNVMMPHFSSKPGTYYSDALFYISLGLHRIAPHSQRRALVLDCDLYFKEDVRLVFEEFDRFKPTALFGLAPELTPVYRHILQNYRRKNNSTFGEFYRYSDVSKSMPHPRGFQGYNSGVVLINLSAIRKSKEFSKIIKNDTIQYLTLKYKFKGHLGDQDFYTLTGFEYPHLIQTLNCGFNRQLCTWWRDHGYKDIFDYYYKCTHPTIILHGNCNTKIPR